MASTVWKLVCLMCIYYAIAFRTESFPSFPRSGEPCFPYDRWSSFCSADGSQHCPCSLLGSLLFVSNALGITLSTQVSHTAVLCLFLGWNLLPLLGGKGTIITFYEVLGLEICLGVILLFNPHCLNMAWGRGHLTMTSWTGSKN